MSGEFQDKWLGHKEATLDFKQLSEFQTRQICQKMAKFIWTDAKYWLNRFMLFVTTHVWITRPDFVKHTVQESCSK